MTFLRRRLVDPRATVSAVDARPRPGRVESMRLERISYFLGGLGWTRRRGGRRLAVGRWRWRCWFGGAWLLCDGAEQEPAPQRQACGVAYERTAVPAGAGVLVRTWRARGTAGPPSAHTRNARLFPLWLMAQEPLTWDGHFPSAIKIVKAELRALVGKQPGSAEQIENKF